MAKQIDWRILEAILRIKNVRSEKSLEWIDTKEPKPHPNPSFPIDEIMDSKFNGNEFYFNGFLERSPWYEWYIESREFELNILKMKILEPGTEL
ncbi:hypothetical protein CH381_31535 [Leptospira sp. mixed culture ATI2-C-A1]|nr:hypothetical protein CH381_31535 [Leptospira sp. mixed culture ATI2-C-A1]